jgi:hypothetical protein
MTTPASAKRPLNKNTLYLIMMASLISVIVAWSWEPYLGLALSVAGVGTSAFLVLRAQRGLVRYTIFTECESCGALLQGHAGLPDAVCSYCGQKQFWAKRN